MDLISTKFKYLNNAQSLLGKKTVPAFKKMKSKSEQIDLFSAGTIIRSALSGEAEANSLLSGKSLSIGKIKNHEEAKEAQELIWAQSNLAEVIFQEEIFWDHHLTLVYEKDFFFVEMKSKDESIPPRFFYWTPIGQTSNDLDESGLITKLTQILKKLQPLTSGAPLWLMELGLSTDELFLFQIQPVAVSFLTSLFSQNLVQEMLLSRQRFSKNQNLFGMMKTEWRAFWFRKRHLKTLDYHPSWIFLNWEFIFHYFRLYSLQKNIKPTQESFGEFLSIGHTKTWMGEILRIHFKLANELRLHEDFEAQNFIFNHSSDLIFIGKGIFQGKIKDEMIMIEDLTPESVYALVTSKIILTKTISLLGHGILAATERKMRVVAGINEETWNDLLTKEIIYLDFEKRLLKLE